MTIKSRNLFAGLLLPGLICFSLPVLAQQAVQKAEHELQRKKDLEKKAYALVDEIANGALGLKLAENRAFVLAAAANLLWRHDKERARALFWEALGSINLMTLAAGNEHSAKQFGKQKTQQQYYAIFLLRQGLVRKAALHDPELALEMLRSSRRPLAEQFNSTFAFPDDSELEQQIATEAAARDPQQALRLARESLKKGFSFHSLELLDSLNARDQDVAAKFARDLIGKLQSTNIATDIFASRVAVDMVMRSREPSGPALLKDPDAAWAYQLKLDKEQRRQLVELISNAALGVSANSTLLNSLNEITPEIQEFVPERTTLLQRKVSAFEQTLNSEQRGWNTFNTLVRNGSPEELIAASLKTDDEQQYTLRQQAVVLAVHRQLAETLREFIKFEIADDSVRRSLLDDVDTQQINAATARGDSDELRKLLPQIRRAEERGRAMAEIAVVLENKGDHEEAEKLLDEARTLIKVDFESEKQTDALFTLVAACAVVEPPKAFGILEGTIDRANNQISKALLLDKIVKTGAVRNGEILLENSNVISPSFVLFRYGKALLALADADFNRTKAAADRLERPELRLWARLLLAESLLRKDGRKTK